MSLDFPLILLVLVTVSGLIWLSDVVWFGPRRRANDEATGVTSNEPVSVEYARSFFPMLFIIFVLRSFIVEPFQIPSSSMVPTLEVGDYILVNKFSYGLRLPVARTKVVELGFPERGDVVVFFPPHQNKTYFIKRVIGIPGDVVEYSNKRLTVNGVPIELEFGEVVIEGGRPYHVATESLSSEDSREIQLDPMRPARDFKEVVRPGHYFMMGDNRDNSSDSRVWGQVPETDIVGKAFAIWMHWESVLSIPSFDRVGGIR
ncbi:MAG: signal peptidase I [Proteobacteria bacterium]|nr:signal peptidase I [Pseudomonadota bacterium]